MEGMGYAEPMADCACLYAAGADGHHRRLAGRLESGSGSRRSLPGRAREFDTSLGAEALFLHGVESYSEVTDFAEARRWFNFGELEVDASGRLTARIIDGLGQVIWETTLSPR